MRHDGRLFKKAEAEQERWAVLLHDYARRHLPGFLDKACLENRQDQHWYARVMDQADPGEAVRMLDPMLVFCGDDDIWTKARSRTAAAAIAASARQLESHPIGEADRRNSVRLRLDRRRRPGSQMQDLTAFYIVDCCAGPSVSSSPARRELVLALPSNPGFEKLVPGARLAFVAVDRQGYRPTDPLGRHLRGWLVGIIGGSCLVPANPRK